MNSQKLNFIFDTALILSAQYSSILFSFWGPLINIRPLENNAVVALAASVLCAGHPVVKIDLSINDALDLSNKSHIKCDTTFVNIISYIFDEEI